MSEVIGRVAVSRAGRDKGRRFAVIGVADDAHVLLADGDVRKVSHPKKKKLMHLQFERARMEGLQAILAAPGGTADAAIRKALQKSADDQKTTNQEEG